MIKVGIVGGTGYTGVELLRLLALHPQVDVDVVTSRAEKGLRVDSVYPSLRGFNDLCFVEPVAANLLSCDVVFFATPNATAMHMAKELLAAKVKVIDLSADFRLKDVNVWEEWYGAKHVCPELLEQAVYGLPETNRQAIKTAMLVANPGCYPTATQLGFLPLITNNVIDTSMLISDAKSGVSGAGRSASVVGLMSESGESFKAYGVPGHRHLPEISQELQAVSKTPISLTFTPHLVPMVRGIHATLYAPLKNKSVDLQALFEDFYTDEPFVDVLPAGEHPDTGDVRGTNRCQIAVHQPQGGSIVTVLSVIDNLVKGASGQAVHNMNIMFGLDERAGLHQVGLYP
ncbi:MAG: N-acetyl-gamma-glutamyl-phosphate reductase [Piscirickettsiaceae bacterium]|nr:MAG: N-acetyl-gamma-glutamyl-phosphate reductase [Piscirickettsiaceae bacterium]PCH84905.1 MAG: N-acetyl-gamma-glutamyl-phosphate reductase [Piscirickettsiaceae bacterium]